MKAGLHWACMTEVEMRAAGMATHGEEAYGAVPGRSSEKQREAVGFFPRREWRLPG